VDREQRSDKFMVINHQHAGYTVYDQHGEKSKDRVKETPNFNDD